MSTLHVCHRESQLSLVHKGTTSSSTLRILPSRWQVALRWFDRQVRNESGDDADVGNDAEDDGEDREPEGVARGGGRSFVVPLGRRPVGLGREEEVGGRRRRGGRDRRRREEEGR